MTKSKHLRLKDDVGGDRAVDEEDTLNTKHALKKIGYYEEPEYGMTGYPDQQMLDGIEKVQEDRGLTRDGIMKPGGETEWEINRIADEQEYAQREEKKFIRPGNKKGHIGDVDEKGHLKHVTKKSRSTGRQRGQDSEPSKKKDLIRRKHQYDFDRRNLELLDD